MVDAFLADRPDPGAEDALQTASEHHASRLKAFQPPLRTASTP